MPFGISLE